MKQCTNCGANIPGNASFCSGCGSAVRSTSPSRGLLIGGAALVMLILAVGAWLIVSGGDEESTESLAAAVVDTADSDTSTTASTESPTTTTIAVTTTEPPTTTTQPDAGTTTTLAPIEILPSGEVSAAASSVLPNDQDPNRYAAANTLDAVLETAWNHCGTGCPSLVGDARQGVGVTIRYSFAEPIELTGFRIANGYQKISDSVGDVWPKNNRVASFDVRTESGTASVVLTDSKGYQEIDAPLGVTGWVEFTVTGVYYGDGTYNDLAISEIEFLIRRIEVGA